MLTVTLPLEGETWDAEDLVDLQLAVRERALALDVRWPWYVKVRPNVEEEQEEDDQPDPGED